MPLMEKLTPLTTCIIKEEGSQVNDLKFYLYKLEKKKKDQMKLKINRRKEIIKIKVEINEIENKKDRKKSLMS